MEHGVVRGMPPTKAGVIQFFTGMRKAFSGFTLIVHDMIAEGDKVFARTIMSGIKVGEFMGMPATGTRGEVPIADYFSLANGKVAEQWGVTDTGTMKEQLGASYGAATPSSTACQRSTSMPLEPGSRLGPYAVTATIGEGGLGEVCRTRDARLTRVGAAAMSFPYSALGA